MSAPAEVALARWRAVPLWLSLAGFSFGTWTGAALLFFGAFLPERQRLIDWHWIAGLAMLAPYSIYQLRHYLRVRGWTGRAHFNVGLATFCSVVALLLSGIPLIFMQTGGTWFEALDLAHILVSFAFLILICAHLALVTRLTLAKQGETPSQISALRAVKLALWLPPIIGLAALLAAV